MVEGHSSTREGMSGNRGEREKEKEKERQRERGGWCKMRVPWETLRGVERYEAVLCQMRRKLEEFNKCSCRTPNVQVIPPAWKMEGERRLTE